VTLLKENTKDKYFSKFTLPKGSYKISASSTFHVRLTAIIRLINTDEKISILGLSSYQNPAYHGGIVSSLIGVVNCNKSETFKIEYYASQPNTGYDLGATDGAAGVYTQVFIEKVG
jgi:hypothetical protein